MEIKIAIIFWLTALLVFLITERKLNKQEKKINDYEKTMDKEDVD